MYKCTSETSHLQTARELRALSATIECQQPSRDLYKFVGRVHLASAASMASAASLPLADGAAPLTVPLGPEHLVLRGSRLQETDYIHGTHVEEFQQISPRGPLVRWQR